jgi:hypothetical protein
VLLNIGPGGITATLLSLFEAGWTAEGVEVRWRFGVTGRFVGARLERGGTGNGPWSAVSEMRDAGGEITVLLDRGTEAGHTYYYRIVATEVDGSVVSFGPLSVVAGQVVGAAALVMVAPNPSPGMVQVEFEVAREAPVRLSVLDVQGRLVAVLAEGVRRPGRHLAAWDGTGESGRMPPGLYFVRYTAPGTSVARRVVLSR